MSEPALASARRNFALNLDNAQVRAARHETVTADVFGWISAAINEPARYDLIVIDPPALAKQQAEQAQALVAYERLAQSGIALLAPDGILVAASCSSRVSEEDFFATIHRAARSSGAKLHEIERTGHALDHPVGFAEGAYLKCLFARLYRQ